MIHHERDFYPIWQNYRTVAMMWTIFHVHVRHCRIFLQLDPVRNGIHDAIFRYADQQRIVLAYRACVCHYSRGTDTYVGTNRSQSLVNRPSFSLNGPTDVQSAYHQQ